MSETLAGRTMLCGACRYYYWAELSGGLSELTKWNGMD